MDRAYFSSSPRELSQKSDTEILGQLASKLPFAVEPTQRSAWEYQIRHLREIASGLPDAHFFLEFLIPRMGRRADLIILESGLVFAIEYKLGASHYDRSSLDQVYGYGLDLKHFHETSHDRSVVPVLVATEAAAAGEQEVRWDEDSLAHPLRANPRELVPLIQHLSRIWGGAPLDPAQWLAGRYRPTPTIVEAAQALYRGHAVEEISRSEAGAENLSGTADYISRVIEAAKQENTKTICFVTGVPGSGKTLAGLNIATARQRLHCEEHAVFLSGNGPLVTVLREALALDAVARAREAGQPTSKTQEHRRASTFIQNIHHFRDDALASESPPIEKVAIFDEAQRAWDVEQTSRFMQQKRGQLGFAMSEPEFLLSVMDRHTDWAVIICLVGGGQEINTGEAGIEEWLRAVRRSFPHWQVHLPDTIPQDQLDTFVPAPALHLATSIRSFRSEKLSDFIGHVIEGDVAAATALLGDLTNFPLMITRDLNQARDWLRSRRRGSERAGLLASSNAARLKPHGVFVKAKIEPEKWFLAPPQDVRSSDALEDVATEFDVQGLELDWACVSWDANLRRTNGRWEGLQFKGTRWQAVNDEARKAYLANSYRVLLTRARQGLIIFVPEGDHEDLTRPTSVYNGIYRFLSDCGFVSVPPATNTGQDFS